MGYVQDAFKGDLFHEHPIKQVISDPADAKEGSLIINSTDDGMKVYYNGSWQLLHTLNTYALLLEDSSYVLLEDGFKLQLN